MTQTNEKNDAVDLVVRTWRERVGFGPNFPLHSPSAVERAMEAEIAELRAARAQAGALTNNQIASGAAVLCDHGQPIGRNAAIDVADAMLRVAQHVRRGAGTERVAASADLTAAARDVLFERRRQVDAEDWTHEHDDAHPGGEIAAYAALYAMPPAAREWPAEETGYGATWGEALLPADWTPPKFGDRRRELVKAGALLLAEIERLDRATRQSSAQKGGEA